MNDKPLLILDLDETLIHAAEEPLERPADFQVYKYHVYKRPYLHELIQNCRQHFRIAVWSSASDDYVQAIVKEIFPQDLQLEFVWGRSRCTPMTPVKTDEYGYFNIDGFSHYNYTKQIRKVRRKGYNINRILIVDDTPQKVCNCYGNAIYMPEFTGDTADAALLWLSQYLQQLSAYDNMRCIEKRNWQLAYQQKNTIHIDGANEQGI